MFEARVQVVRFGGEAGGEIFRQIRFEKSFGFRHHAFGNSFRNEQRVEFQRGGQRRAPCAEFTVES